MTYPSYPEYKDSGVAWLGQVPAHWEVKKLKFISKVQPSNVDKKTIEDEIPVVLCNYTDVYKNEFIRSEMNFMQATATAEEIKKFQVDINDVIITKDSESRDDIAVPACIADEVPDLVCGYHLTQIKPISIDGRYLFRLFQSDAYNSQFIVAANGVTRFGLPQYAISNAATVLPPLPEQQAIARFLDIKTAQIDALIAKKQALLEKLAEKRTALISTAVTKGLTHLNATGGPQGERMESPSHPGAPMKDSGIAWLGEIPAHWEVKRLRHLLKQPFANGLFKKKDHWGTGTRIVNVFDVYVDGGAINDEALDRVSCDESEAAKYSALHGDFFFVRSSLKLEGIGKSSLILCPKEQTVFECHLVRGRPKLDCIHPEFLNLILNSDYCRKYLISMANQVTMATLDQQKFKQLAIALPSLEEQEKIFEHIFVLNSQLSNQISSIETAITKLQEYRSALITHAVTGKINVQDVVLPEPVPEEIEDKEVA